jgi:hypothetical protein
MPIRTTIVSFAVALSLVFAASAQAYVYWGVPQSGLIGRANNDGTGVEASFIHTGGRPIALAVTSTHIYWANESGVAGTIGRANINGTEVDPNFITGIAEPRGVAVSPAAIFWTSLSGNEIGEAPLDGSTKTLNFVAGVSTPCGIAIDGGHVYWGGGATPAFVWRATLTGGSPEREWVNLGGYIPCGVAVNSANVFAANFGLLGHAHEIGRAALHAGATFEPSLLDEAEGPCGLTINSSRLYWANDGNGTIGVANTDGTSPNAELVKTGGGEICGVAVDSLSTPINPPPTSPPPSGPSPPPPPLTGS